MAKNSHSLKTISKLAVRVLRAHSRCAEPELQHSGSSHVLKPAVHPETNGLTQTAACYLKLLFPDLRNE